jgi:hypoxanthine-guanine phosphoribosyltransferase
VKNLEFGDFPLSKSEVTDALQALVKQFRARYTSRFTLVALLPQSLWAAKKIEEEFEALKAPVHLVGLGIMPTERDGKRSYSIIEPPSVHSIKGKKVVIFSTIDPTDILLAAGTYIRNMRPQSIEISSLFVKGEIPEWLNPDYIAYTIPTNVIATGLGLGYNEEQASGGAITGTLVELPQDAPPATDSEKPEEVSYERS